MEQNVNKNYELDLPSGYKLVKHIDAKDKKTGIIFNLIAFLVLIVVMIVSFIAVNNNGGLTFDIDPGTYLIGLLVFFLVMIAYIILHELVHGIAYYALTKQKLTLGLSWSCAFCGVPNIFCNRKTALIALVSPLITFTVILIPVTIILFSVNSLVFIASSFILGLHLGGCSGDIYMTILLLFKYKDKDTLIKDTGPEQYIYVKE